MTARSVALFVAAAVTEIGGAYLMWQAIKDGRGPLFALAGAVALAGYGAIAALQPDSHFGRILAAYCGVFTKVRSHALPECHEREAHAALVGLVGRQVAAMRTARPCRTRKAPATPAQ